MAVPDTTAPPVVRGTGLPRPATATSEHRAVALWRRPAVPRHVWVAASGWASRIVTATIQLVSVRILLQTLGLENYAIFALLTGLQGWFLLADMGIGISAQNHLSESKARDVSAAPLILRARLLALLLLLLTIVALYAATPSLSSFLLRSFPALAPDAKTELLFVSGSLSIGFGIGSIVYKIWYAEQRGYLANIVPAAAALMGLLGIWLAGFAPPPLRLLASLVAFLAPTAVMPLSILARQICIGLREKPPMRPMRSQMVGLGRRAAAFWVFAVLAALTLQIDYVVLSQFLAASDIAIYTLTTKIYGLTFFVYNALLLALWPTWAELFAQRDVPRLQSFLSRYLTLGVGYMMACSLAMIWLMPIAVRLLSRDPALLPSLGLILGMGAYYTIRVWTDTFATLLQSMSNLRPFWLLVPAQALLSAALQWLLAPRFGLVGIVTGLSLSFLLTVVWALPVATRRCLTRLDKTTL